MSTSEVDAAFSVLPTSVRMRIDRAFDDAIGFEAPSPRKRRKLSKSVDGRFITTDASSAGGFTVDDPAPGGFIIDDLAPGGFIPDINASTGGGFIVDEDDASEGIAHEGPSQIPLSLIPTALQSLDLPPDDEDVLSVFRNAASGWGDSSRGRPRDSEDEQFVSRKDWRAVCAALLDTGVASNDAGENDEDVEMRDEVDEEDDVPSGEEFNSEDSPLSSMEEDDDDDEYNEGGFVTTKKTKGKQPARKIHSRKKAVSPSDSEPDDDGNASKRITPRQKAECRRTFALFFPDVEDEKLDKKCIMIRDISRVATLLKEKLSAEDVRIKCCSLPFRFVN